jgi:pullulanase/glycogen debranching enzyme
MEAHIRDLAAHAPIELSDVERRGFKGVQKWLESEYSYIKELGVNAVELQPIQEFDNTDTEEYHWGYMTCNYFSPESSYATAPERACQIEEFRELVQAFHDAGIAVILDVVYNHVGEPNHLLFIDKYYYFNLDDSNDLMNWSGCGNDLRCDTPMGRRLIIDSLKHLVQAFGVDGFRFDLAELIGVDVLREIETELKQVKPEIILIAEPWSFRGHIQDALKASGYASWNDGFREGMVKYVRGMGNQDMIRYFLSGSPNVSRFAAQSINYTESHDDLCWLDRITESPNRDGRTVQLIDRQRTHLMASILFTALGIPMLAAGQDFLRSKSGVQNTYKRGDLNALDYNQAYVHAGTQAYFKAWIAFRQSADGKALRLDGPFEASYINFYHVEGSSAVLALYNADRSRPCGQILFAVNPHAEFASIACPDLSDFDLMQIADHERFDLNGLSSGRFRCSEDRLHIPPMACGLWLVNASEN